MYVMSATPQAIGCTDHEVTLHQIGHRLRVKASTSRTNPPPSANALKPRLAHQASYSLAAYPNTVGCQARHALAACHRWHGWPGGSSRYEPVTERHVSLER